MKRLTIRRKILYAAFFFMAASLCTMGVSYAAWSDKLGVRQNVATGTMTMRFESENDFLAGITDRDGEWQATLGEEEVVCEIDDDGRGAALTIAGELLTEELEESGNMLALRCRLIPQEDSTVLSARTFLPDFEKKSKETVRASLWQAALVLNGQEFTLPKGLGKADAALSFEVYRKIEQDGDGIEATLYLKPIQKSRKELTLRADQLPQEMTEFFALQGLQNKAASFEAELVEQYTLELSFYAEQPH
jgi:hypothetical protein